jgi:hypothetical protein
MTEAQVKTLESQRAKLTRVRDQMVSITEQQDEIVNWEKRELETLESDCDHKHPTGKDARTVFEHAFGSDYVCEICKRMVM